MTHTHTCERVMSVIKTQRLKRRMEIRYSMEMKRQLGWQESDETDFKTKTVTTDKKDIT